MDSLVDELAKEFVEEDTAEWPVMATALGLDGHDEQLGDLSASGFERRQRQTDSWLTRFEAIGAHQLDLEHGIDRDLILSNLRGRRAMRSWMGWRRDPATYLSPTLEGIFTLLINRSYAQPELARVVSARLGQVPGLLSEAQKNLAPELADRTIVRRSMAQCGAAAHYVRTLVPAAVTDAKAQTRLAESGAVAGEAYDTFRAFLRKLLDEARGTYSIGEERYSLLLRERELLGYDVNQLRRRGQSAYDELSEEMSELAARMKPGPTRESKSADWRPVVASLQASHPPEATQMEAAYRRCTDAARRFVVDHDLVSLPEGELCIVAPSPAFQRPVLAVASYRPPPMFNTSQVGHFLVPYPPDGAADEVVQSRMMSNSYSMMPTLAAHEAYPGHHCHFVRMSQNERPIRKVLMTPYSVEGWGLYAEGLMREHGFFQDQTHLLRHLGSRLFRAARVIVDTGLHTGEMEIEEAVVFLRTKVGLTEVTARAEVDRYCARPTQASSYLTGALEIERIRERFLAEARGGKREFNDMIIASGALPPSLAERALVGARSRPQVTD